MEDVDKESQRVQLEIAKVDADITVISNEHQSLLTKLENIKRECQLIEDHIATNKSIEKH